MLKSELRKEIRKRKRLFTEQQLREQSLAIIGQLLQHPRVAAAKTVLFYYSLPDEVYTHDAIDRLVAMGKKVLFFFFLPENEMELRIYTGPHDMREDEYHILEPCGETFTQLDTIDIALVPGMSFDEKGHRLGRGKGYYDRFLVKIPHVYKIGVCFPFQKFPDIPSDEHDVMMDEVI